MVTCGNHARYHAHALCSPMAGPVASIHSGHSLLTRHGERSGRREQLYRIIVLLVASTTHSIERSKRTYCHIMVDRWSSSSYRHRRRGNNSGGGIGKQCFVLPFLSMLIISMANTVMAESVEKSLNTRQKLVSSSTTYKHKHGGGGAVRRIVYSQPRNIERSLQGNNVSAELCV